MNAKKVKSLRKLLRADGIAPTEKDLRGQRVTILWGSIGTAFNHKDSGRAIYRRMKKAMT